MCFEKWLYGIPYIVFTVHLYSNVNIYHWEKRGVLIILRKICGPLRTFADKVTHSPAKKLQE